MANAEHLLPGNPIHIVHVIGSLQTGGAEKMLLNFLAASDKTKFRHTVLCLSKRGEMADQLDGTGVEVIVFRTRFRRFFTDISALAQWFRKHDVKVIHSHLYFASMWSRLAGIKASVPVMVTTEHGKEPWKKWWHIKLDRFLSSKSFHHIAVSEDIRNIRIGRDGILPEKITMIPNGVPIPDQGQDTAVRQAIRTEFRLNPDQPVVGTVGRVIPAKAYPVLLEALALVRKKVPDVHWLQVGDGPQMQEIQALAQSMKLDDMISFAGRRSDVDELLESMDVWVMSSIFEGLPVALLEAMATSKPIVITDAGGITDAVQDGEEALVVPMNQPHDLAEAIIRLIENKELAVRLGSNARIRVQNDYGIIAVAKRIESIYTAGLAAAGL